jgi:chromosome segregation ATPase
VLTAPEKAELTTLTVSSKKVLSQIKALRDAYAAADAETEALRKEIAAAEKRLNAKGTAAAAAAATASAASQPSQPSQPSQQ